VRRLLHPLFSSSLCLLLVQLGLDQVERLLGVAEQHGGVLLDEDGVVSASVAGTCRTKNGVRKVGP